jgi:IPT/TIG domain
MKVNGTVRAIGILTALVFACQIGLAMAAEETKKKQTKKHQTTEQTKKKQTKKHQTTKVASAVPQPGGGIQKKSKGTEVRRYTPTIAQPGGGIQSTKAKAAESSRMTQGKNCATQWPKVKKVTPDEGKTGEKVTITGERFGAPGCVTMVSFGPGSPAKFTHVDDKTLTAVVPDGKNGLELLTVTGSVGEDSKPFLRK